MFKWAKTFEQSGEALTYFFKNGKIKAKGISINGIMKGEWNSIGKPGNCGRLEILKMDRSMAPGFVMIKKKS